MAQGTHVYNSLTKVPCHALGMAHQARAAIAAMREPTEAMLVAEGVNEMGSKERLGEYLDDWSAGGVYRAMIDAALAGK